MRARYVLPLVAATLVVLQACAATQPPPPPSDPRIIVEPALGLRVHSVQVHRNRSDTLDIQAMLTNELGKEQQAQYRWDWIDERGVYIPTLLSRWTPLRVAAGAPSVIQGTAPNPKAYDFQLQIRRNRAEGIE
jgi:uncharacterized protein YcfL